MRQKWNTLGLRVVRKHQVFPRQIQFVEFVESSLTRNGHDLSFRGLLVLGSNEQAWRQGLARSQKGPCRFFYASSGKCEQF